MEEILSQCIHLSNHHIIHFKYITILFVNDTLRIKYITILFVNDTLRRLGEKNNAFIPALEPMKIGYVVRVRPDG